MIICVFQFNGKPLPAGGACGAAYRPLWALLFGALALLAIAGLIAGLVIGLKGLFNSLYEHFLSRFFAIFKYCTSFLNCQFR